MGTLKETAVIERPRVLCISDVRGWAFDQNMRDMETYLSDRFEFEHWYIAEWDRRRASAPRFDEFDTVFCLYHRWGIEPILPWPKTVGTLRARWLFPERPTPPAEREFQLVNQYRAYHVVTQANYDEFSEHCPRVVYLTNPVNMDRFPVATSISERVVASWNGNALHAGRSIVKGFYGIVKPACEAAAVPLKYAEYNTCRLDASEMPEFYRQANLALCASMYEGASNSVMEAMASGLAVVVTDVGNHREMHESMLAEYGESGMLIVPRRKQAFVAALEELKRDPARVVAMGKLNRAEIRRAWSWEAWSDRYAEFLMTPMKGRD